MTFADEASERAASPSGLDPNTAKRKIHLRDKAVRVLEKRLLSRKAKLAAFALAHAVPRPLHARARAARMPVVVIYYFSLVGFGRCTTAHAGALYV